MIIFFFFFSSRRRHTRLQGDWSSDVCSSDLEAGILAHQRACSAGVVQVDVREKNGVEIAHADATCLQLAMQGLERGARAGVDNGAVAVRLEKRSGDGSPPPHPKIVERGDRVHKSRSVAQDGKVGSRQLRAGRRKYWPHGKRGSSCTESKLWNNLIAPSTVASSDFSLGPDLGVGECGCLERKKRQVQQLRCVQRSPPSAASGLQAGASTKRELIDKAWEERDAQ